MPTSRSKPSTEPAAAARIAGPIILIVALAVLIVVVIALPASLVQRFLPPGLRAEDFSGTLWHGSAGKITVDGRDAGAVEWRIHPASLLRLGVSAELHWVKVSFLADASVDLDRHGVTARNIQGGGPLDSLQDIGMPGGGLRGIADFKLQRLALAFTGSGATPTSAVGDIHVSDLVVPQIAGGADLGGYALRLADGAITPDTDVTAELNDDTRGPLEVHATLHYSAKEHTGLLSGTIKERPDAPPALHSQVDSLAQLHAPDAQGRIPVELEFTL